MTRVLVTANKHFLYNKVVTITHSARMDGHQVWVVLSDDGITDYVREGEFKVVKRQGDEDA